MKIFVSCDMEGIAGVVTGRQVKAGNDEWRRFRKLMTEEILHVVNILKMVEVDNIIINEGHGSMCNIYQEEMPMGVNLIQGEVKPLWMMEGLNESFDAVMFVGYHARAGTQGGVLDHTFGAFDFKVNGKNFGEIGLNSLLAMHFKVPVIFISGDEAACKEAKDIFPNINSVVTKKGIARHAAECYPREAVFQMYKEELRNAIESLPRTWPYTLPDDFIMEITFPAVELADFAFLIPGLERIDGRTVQYKSDTYLDVYKIFHLIMALRGFYRN